jgi:hypothetical protein
MGLEVEAWGSMLVKDYAAPLSAISENLTLTFTAPSSRSRSHGLNASGKYIHSLP